LVVLISRPSLPNALVTFGRHFEQWAIAATPRHPVLRAVLDAALPPILEGTVDSSYEHFVHATTGPGIFTQGVLTALAEMVQLTQEHKANLDALLATHRGALERQGVCLLSRQEVEARLQNMYASGNSDFRSATWTSWTEERNKAVEAHKENELQRQRSALGEHPVAAAAASRYSGSVGITSLGGSSGHLRSSARWRWRRRGE
jgi:hypothetical protein